MKTVEEESHQMRREQERDNGRQEISQFSVRQHGEIASGRGDFDFVESGGLICACVFTELSSWSIC